MEKGGWLGIQLSCCKTPLDQFQHIHPVRYICVIHLDVRKGKSSLKLKPGAVCCVQVSKVRFWRVEKPPWKVMNENVGVQG